MNCPRCRTENGAAAIRCAGCGAPIALADDSAATPLDRPLDLDRRAGRREPPSRPADWEASEETPRPIEAGPASAWPSPVPLDWEMEPPVEGGTSRPDPLPARFPSRARPGPPEPPAAEFDVDADVEAIEVHRERAPSWRRAVSWGIDGALLAALAALLLAPVLGGTGPSLAGGLDGAVEGIAAWSGVLLPAVLVVALVAFAYQWLGVALMGATPGLRAAGLRVVAADGHRPSPGRSAVRSLAALPAAALLGTGILLALFTRSGRGAHDLVAGTWVVRARGRGGRP